jgi:hypothetical protein
MSTLFKSEDVTSADNHKYVTTSNLLAEQVPQDQYRDHHYAKNSYMKMMPSINYVFLPL